MEKLQLILSLIEGTNDLIHSIKPEGDFEFVNRAWLETLGYEESEVDSLRLQDILFPGQIRRYREMISDIMEGNVLTDAEVIFLTKDGEMVHTKGSLFPRREGAKIIAATGFFRNVTERKETEERLKESRARTEFLVDLMVHDLTNINQEVLSMFEVLLYNPAFPSQLEGLVREGLKEVERASDLIANVRKITRLYSAAPEMMEKDLAEAIAVAARSVNESFPDKKLALDTEIKPGQYFVIADEFLRDVFYSLLHNSMRFDKRPIVKVEIDAQEVKHTPFLRIQVKDYGPGIPDEEKEAIFARLSHRRESILGLGLGLTLVKKILENYGSYIRVEDRVEGDHSKGANFIILMRYKQREEKKEEGE